MIDFYNLPIEFWSSLEFVCIFFGLLPLVLIQVVALGLICVDIVRESRWYMNRGIRTVYVQTDEDPELMEFYASGASPLDLIPDSSSSTGSTTPPYPSTSSSDPAPSTSSQSTSPSSLPPDPSPSGPASTPGAASSASSETNQVPEPSTSSTQTTQLSTLQEIVIEHQPSKSGASQASDCIDGWSNLDGWSSPPPPPPPPPPPKITSMLLKKTSSGNLTKGKSPSCRKSPMRVTLSFNSNIHKGVSSTFSKNPFATYEKTAVVGAAARDKSDDAEMFDFSSGAYRKSPFALWDDDFSSSANVIEERAIASEKSSREAGSTETAFDHGANGRSSSPDSICKSINGTDCKSSVRSSLGSSSLKSASSDPYMSEVYMGIV